MSRRALALFEEMQKAYRKSAEETARVIPEAELDLIPDQMETLLGVQHALAEAYPEVERLGSLLATDVAGVLHHLTGLHFDIMTG